MSDKKVSPQDQKARLLDERKKLDQRIAEFDTRRAATVGVLAKKFKLTDLADEILETEFKAIQMKYKASINLPKSNNTIEHATKKNSNN